jgi:hypothetical protein
VVKGFVRHRWSFDATRVQPPEISNFKVELFQLKGCPGSNGTVSFFRWSFDYSDPNGNVPNSVPITFSNIWLPTLRTTNVTVRVQRSGTGVAGTVISHSCILFDVDGIPDDEIRQTIYITDTSGLRSNSLTFTTRRP